MSTQVPNVNKASSGLCPHGLPPGACPICSNMGGGGSTRVGERPQKAGEMSEDDLRGVEDKVQKITDKFVAKADELVSIKEKEVMEV